MTRADGTPNTDDIGPVGRNTPAEKTTVARLATTRLSADDAATVIAALKLQEYQ